MSAMLVLVTGLFMLWCGHTAYKTARRNKSDNAYAVAHGCQPVPKLDTGRWPIGLGLIVTAFRVANEQRLLRFMNEIVEKTGNTFEQNLLGARGIDTVEPANIEALLSTQFTDFGLGERRLVFAPLLGDGIFTQDGKSWERSRALLRPAFHNQDRSLTQIAAATGVFIKLIRGDVPIDLTPLFFRYTLDTTSYVLFGQRLGALDLQENDDVASFAAAFDRGQDYLAKRGRLGGLYWLIDGFDFRRNCKRVHEHVDKLIIDAMRKRKLEGNANGTSARSILDSLLEQTADIKILREQCLNVLLAGRDTTACLLTWTFRLLARHPAVFDCCRQEILDICTSDSEPTRAEIKRLRYLDAVLKEVLRLYPSVPINSRLAVRTTTLPTGGGPDGKSRVLVRKGEAVGYCPYAMHRRQDIFGADATAFRPERWLEQDGRLAATVGFGYLPFNAGPRLCLGQNFALMEASALVVQILRRFSRLTLPAGEPVCPAGDERQLLTLVVSSAEGCRVILG